MISLKSHHPLPFVSAVLKPDLHLCLSQFQILSKARSLSAVQIASRFKGCLQLGNLVSREHRSGLFLSQMIGMIIALPTICCLIIAHDPHIHCKNVGMRTASSGSLLGSSSEP